MFFGAFIGILILSTFLLQGKACPMPFLLLDDPMTWALLTIWLQKRLYYWSNLNLRILTFQMELIYHHFVEVCVNFGFQEHQELFGFHKLGHIILR